MHRTAIALFVLLAGPHGALSSGLVCVGTSSVAVRTGSADCRAGSDRFAIAPISTSRPFARIDGEGRKIVLGELPAGANSVEAVDDAEERISLPISFRTSEPVASTCNFAITPVGADARASRADAPAKWSFEVTGQDLRAQRKLHLPPGRYRMAIDCGAEFSAEPVIVDARKGGGTLPDVQLNVVAVPRISGRIASPAEAAAVAVLQDNEGRYLGRPEADGSFRVFIPVDFWPRSIVVSAAGYGPVVMSLPEGPTAIQLPDVQLKKAGRIVIAAPAEQLAAIDSIEVFELRGKRQRFSYRTLSKDALRQSKFTIDVAPGRYLLVLRGKQPLERFGVTAELAAGEERQLAIELAEQNVDVRTFVGDQHLGNAEIVVESVETLWNTTFRTSSEGGAKLRLWQPGEVVFVLESPEMAGYSGTLDMRGPRVDIRVPSRSVEGKVVDALTDEPLVNVNVGLTDGKGGTMTTSAPDGTFKFVGVKPGAYRISAGGANGLSQETVSIQVHEDVSVRRVRLALRRQQEFDLEIVSWNGNPAADAAVVELSGPTVMSLRQADQAGMVRLPLQASGPRSVVIVAADAGLYAQPLPQKPEPKVRVTIPPASSSITIAVGTNADRPISGVSLVMRLNGVLFPGEVMQLLHARAGVILTSDENGQIRLPRVPAGLYEFWPIRSRSELQAILTGQPPAAPIVIAAGPGENKATLGFSAVRGTSP